MSLHECPDCGTEVATNDTCVGGFDLPPTLVCVECGVEMSADPKVTVEMDEVRHG